MTTLPFLRPTLLGALLGLQIAAQAARAAPAEVRFDTTPRAGMHQRQTMDMKSTMSMRIEAGPDATEEQRAKIAQKAGQMADASNIKMTMRLQHTTQVGQPDVDGWLPLTFTSGNRSVSMEVGGKAIPVPNAGNADMRMTARFDPRSFDIEVQTAEGGPPGFGALMTAQGKSMLNDAFKLQKALAQRTLKVGDSVDVPLSMNLPVPLPGAAGGLQGQVHYTLVKVTGGVAYFDLNLTMDIQMNTPLPTPPVAAASDAASGASAPASAAEATPARMLRMVMKGSGKGTSTLRLADQLPLSTQLAMNMQMTVDGPDNSRMLMDMVMDTTSKGENLAKKPAAAPKKKN